MMKYFIIVLAHLFVIGLQGQTIIQAEYFIDDDPGFGLASQIAISATDTLNTTFDIDLSNVSEGYHTLYIRLKDNDDEWSVVNTRNFYKDWNGTRGTSLEIQQLEYFVDTDPGFGLGSQVAIQSDSLMDLQFQVDVSNLPMGLHKLFLRARDDADNWSIVNVRAFYKSWSGDSLSVFEIVQAEYFIDNDPGFGQGQQIVLAANDVIEGNFPVDISQLSVGYHEFHCRVKDTRGRWSLVGTESFFKAFDFNGTNANIVNIEYFIDSDPGFGNGVALTGFSPNSQVNSTDIVPLNHLAAGNHRIYFRAMDDKGQWSLIASMPFVISHCYDGIKNEDEEYVDCGGADCMPCTDCSHVDVTISDQPIEDQTYIRASNDIISDGLVTGNTLVILQAENTLLLRSGFKVLNNGHFVGKIAPCNE